LGDARELERSRLARALHDEALQGLTEAAVLAMSADRGSSGSQPQRQVVSVLRRVGEQLRGAIYDLRLGAEEHRPFPELVEELVEVHREMAGVCENELELGDGIPTGSLGGPGLEVLRILGEALTNARRHADARHVRIRVWGTNDTVGAEVSDDGHGFDPRSRMSPAHQGIRGMRERGGLLGGYLEIHSKPGAGTTVPLEATLTDGTTGDS
jgi:signal transduction histidine kinase